MNNQNHFLVCVRCFTFNHVPYIKDAMDGFCMQQTSFPYICIIVDDASTDGEQEVIKSYLVQNFNLDNQEIVRNEETDNFVMTFAQHKTNENCFFAVYYLKYNHYSIKKDKFPYFAEYHDNARYIALCEGDDYWTDPRKLQKQSDVLDNNPDMSMVYTAFKTVNEKSLTIHRPRYDRYIRRSHTGNILPELFYSNYILTLTIMFRREVLHSNLYVNTPNKYDYALFFAAAFLGKCYFIPDVMGCYRKNEGSSITSRLTEVERGLYQVYKYFVDRFLNEECEVECTMIENVKIYRNMFVNLFFHSDYQYVKRIMKRTFISILLIPESFAFSLLKKLKWKTYGSIDR